MDREPAVGGKVAGTSFAAKNTPSRTKRSVTVRTGSAGIKGYLVDLGAELIFEIIAERVIVHQEPRFG